MLKLERTPLYTYFQQLKSNPAVNILSQTYTCKSLTKFILNFMYNILGPIIQCVKVCIIYECVTSRGKFWHLAGLRRQLGQEISVISSHGGPKWLAGVTMRNT